MEQLQQQQMLGIFSIQTGNPNNNPKSAAAIMPIINAGKKANPVSVISPSLPAA